MNAHIRFLPSDCGAASVRGLATLLFAAALGHMGASSASADAGRAACVIGAHEGFEDADARTATNMVCDALRQRGVTIGEATAEEPASGTAYRVTFDKLGKALFITLKKEEPAGSLTTQRRMQLAAVEEVVVVAPRLAEAVLENVSLDTTRRVDNIAKAEGRKNEQLSGDFGWGPSIQGFFFPQTDVLAAPAVGMNFWYETSHVGIGASFRFVLGEELGDEDGMFAVIGDVGSRYLFLTEDFTPFVGGGLTFGGYSWSRNHGDDYDYGYNDTDARVGFGAYAEAGIELLRFHRTHLLFNLRMDLPFFALKSNTYEYNEVTGEESRTTERYYVPPVSVGATILF